MTEICNGLEKMKIIFLCDDENGGGKVANESIYQKFIELFPKNRVIFYTPNYPSRLFPPIRQVKRIVWYLTRFKRFFQHNRFSPNTILLTTSVVSLAAIRFLEFKIRRRCLFRIFFLFHAERWITHQGLSVLKNESFFQKISWRLFCFIFKMIQRYLFREVYGFITFSNSHIRYLNVTYRIPLKKIRQVNLGVDHSIFKSLTSKMITEQRRRLGIKRRQKVMLFSGRIDDLKGISCLIDATALIRHRYDVFLIIVGVKDKNEYWKKLITYAKKILCNNFIFFFNLKHESLPQYYSMADCVVLPSLTENAPLVLLEALACGAVFSGTKVGNIPEILKQINHKLILSDNNPESIATVLEYIFSLKFSVLTNLKKKAISVSRKYDWEQTTKDIYAIINS